VSKVELDELHQPSGASYNTLYMIHYPNYEFECAAKAKGYTLIAGVDEAGRGPLAGPVVAAACILPDDFYMNGINDSKQLTPKKRAVLFEEIVNHPQIKYGIGIVAHTIIDKINILQATIQAMLIAVDSLSVTPHYLLVDGLKLPHPCIPNEKIIKGDALSYSIAAASVIAKETRDRLMDDFDIQWPQYGFAKHKGYGTAKHLAAIQLHGPCPIHRLSFAPLKSTIS
jgi:ribonuclease HII